MKHYLGVDPGKRYTGLVLTTEEHVALAALVENQQSGRDFRSIEACLRGITDSLLHLEIQQHIPKDLQIVIEWPQIYRFTKQNPNDLLPLAAVAGAVAAWGYSRGDEVTYYLPRTWKGQKSKAQVQRETEDFFGDTCVAFNKYAKSKQEHLYDAAGLAAYHIVLNCMD